MVFDSAYFLINYLLVPITVVTNHTCNHFLVLFIEIFKKIQYRQLIILYDVCR